MFIQVVKFIGVVEGAVFHHLAICVFWMSGHPN